MIDLIAGQRLDLEMLKTQFGNSMRVGPIEVIDPEKGYRIKLGDGEGGPVLSPWYPHPESGGQTSSWMPLSKGQVVGVLHPNGDARQGFMLRGGFTDQNTQPSQDLSANVLDGLGLRISMKDGLLTIEGDVRIQGDIEIEGDLKVTGNVDFADGHVRHNNTNIGDDHVHGGVVRGGANTDGPQ
ncbi:MAG: baseplate assembly protein [Roseibium sp.]